MLSSKQKKKKQKKFQQRLQKSAGVDFRAADYGHADSDDASDTETPEERAKALNVYGWCEAKLGFTADDLEVTTRVLKALGDNIAAFKGQPFKELRGILHPLIEEQMKNYDVKGVLSKRKRKDVASDVASLKEQDREWINRSALRAKRLAALEELTSADATLGIGGAAPKLITHKGEIDEAVEELRKNRALQRVPDGVAELNEQEEAEISTEQRKLNIPINCYTCKRPFVDLHFFYDQLCPACAQLNYMKRNQTVDMTDCVALVTGARVKIGYRCALKLLRCGCTVIATSRFATDCARRYAKEPESDTWINRLQCYGIDFRDLVAVEQFCNFVKSKYSRLDVIINNACQTIRRPAQYYSHLIKAERTPLIELPEKERTLLKDGESFRNSSGLQYVATSATFLPGISCGKVSSAVDNTGEKSNFDSVTVEEIFEDEDDGLSVAHQAPKSEKPVDRSGGKKKFPKNFASADGSRVTSTLVQSGGSADVDLVERTVRKGTAAEISQMVVTEEDLNRCTETFPERADGQAVMDVNEQQVDLRKHNSWVLKLHEVSTGELAEVMAINAIAPAVINARLKGLMESTPAKFKFIVNVSAMEGKFYRWKSDQYLHTTTYITQDLPEDSALTGLFEQHPHTNMAKASLNMMTRTSAQDYVKSGIYMTAVDTGWINDEKPIEQAVEHEETHNFQTPLDEVDAAARVLDPVIAPLVALAKGETVTPMAGVFLKDFVKCEW